MDIQEHALGVQIPSATERHAGRLALGATNDRRICERASSFFDISHLQLLGQAVLLREASKIDNEFCRCCFSTKRVV